MKAKKKKKLVRVKGWLEICPHDAVLQAFSKIKRLVIPCRDGRVIKAELRYWK